MVYGKYSTAMIRYLLLIVVSVVPFISAARANTSPDATRIQNEDNASEWFISTSLHVETHVSFPSDDDVFEYDDDDDDDDDNDKEGIGRCLTGFELPEWKNGQEGYVRRKSHQNTALFILHCSLKIPFGIAIL